ncbi:patatin-like phospholipase family protein [Erythrobacter sp. THAF29]|uniref:patatin-like phospholipase family protein n=1 Tax=Erythrobacter sp. THAF29 TaxID=2587851 RepID=UPI0012681B7A|nr:patatin-like phospholipase family protein [Erythrobacter sp. THAF29]QFT77280.1 Patatin-like phospholipase [Erythrobacter sp. THAF29]
MRDFELLAFSGGGIRCFWHGGFLSVLEQEIDLEPEIVTGVSGGALSAAAWISGRETLLKDLMREAFGINDANVEASSHGMITPHEDLYRAVVSTLLDKEALQRIADGPRFELLLSCPPHLMPGTVATLLYGALYKLDEAIRSDPRLVLPGKAGLGACVADARAAARAGTLVNLVCAAATIPPVFEMSRWGGRRVLDGAFVSKVHLPDDRPRNTLALLTKRYGKLKGSEHITFVSPGNEVAADKIDFTDPDKIELTWQQGEADARRWLVSNEGGSV